MIFIFLGIVKIGGSLTPIFPEQFNDVYMIFFLVDCKDRWFTNPTAVVH